ncbi:zinc ribbon-containing protein [Solemya velum gill symbiont]|uniref:Zinc ribbon-containing protein n=4 Tax=Solemya velum gill symbiont TaxID=2340 RepID=A0A1T2DDU5_SOVGS|nr:zinc ribbon-containing protein [Solemya velum gill symbiont]OOY35425.1 hypothetical protein BOV88_04020 [Solemya velum gill symbiont]OOY38622.1 hypothetical protein BOV89_02155 [Solemya velum gill symbiont]OOY39578.1 hypothetical protein BOV90_08635 [Solemya velum gill symbiont]OOY45248.1 hypothetical protein BOV92_06000 [Solemya velum gill symbiont]OOY48999.1 hypothetical protein BOV93_00805 [Solemya velum gill symbiont]
MKDLEPPHDMVDAIGVAYERMLERAIENSHKISDRSGHFMHDAVDKAHERAVELNELTKDESERVAEYLKRDVEDAARYLQDTGDDLKHWLGFEREVFSDHILSLFAQAADQTTLALKELSNKARSNYETDDVVAPGIFVCSECGHRTQIKKAGVLPPCSECMGTIFTRDTSAEGGSESQS